MWSLPDSTPYVIGQSIHVHTFLVTHMHVITLTLIIHYYVHTLQDLYITTSPSLHVNAPLFTSLLLAPGQASNCLPAFAYGWSLLILWMHYTLYAVYNNTPSHGKMNTWLLLFFYNVQPLRPISYPF